MALALFRWTFGGEGRATHLPTQPAEKPAGARTGLMRHARITAPPIFGGAEIPLSSVLRNSKVAPSPFLHRPQCDVTYCDPHTPTPTLFNQLLPVGDNTSPLHSDLSAGMSHFNLSATRYLVDCHLYCGAWTVAVVALLIESFPNRSYYLCISRPFLNENTIQVVKAVVLTSFRFSFSQHVGRTWCHPLTLTCDWVFDLDWRTDRRIRGLVDSSHAFLTRT